MKFIFDSYTVEAFERNGSAVFKIRFHDSNNVVQQLEITADVFEAFDTAKKIEKKFLNFFDNHIEHQELSNEHLQKRAAHKPKTGEEMYDDVQREMQFDTALDSLTDVQRRRFLMYYTESLSLKAIALIENSNISSVKKSIDAARKVFLVFFQEEI